jgi:S-DNA-T family DNA segregation ATPase FtsK/SpoIIIE
MVAALLVSLAFLSYHAGDRALLQGAELKDMVLAPHQVQADGPAKNILGLLGAHLATVFVPGFLGYAVLLLSGLVMVWGYAIFRHQALQPLLYPSLLTLLAAALLSSLLGWFEHALEASSLATWAGAVGVGVAGWLQHVFGTVGSFVLLLLAGAVLLLLVVDHDVQRSVDRVITALDAAVRSASAAADYVQAQWAHARAHSAPSLSRPSSPAPGSDPEPSPPDDASSSPAPSSTPSTPPRTAPSPPQRRGPVRRNDLFRPGADAPPSSPPPSDETSPPPETPSTLDAPRSDAPPPETPPPSSASPNAADAEPSPPSPSDPPDASASDAPASNAPAASSDDASKAPDEDVSMTIQEQVEEETTDEIERTPDTPANVEYTPPALDLLTASTRSDPSLDHEELEKNKRILLDKLDMYNIEIEEINAVVGPTVTRYELTPAPGVKVSRIKSLEDDLAMAMAAPGVRMIAPIPGKTAIGVEIPNSNRELVRLRDVIGTTKFQNSELNLPLPLGKTIEGEVFLGDLTTMPHLLIAGATGSGKSVGLNALITGLIYACHPANLRFVIIDPKKIELQQYTPLETQFVAVPEDIDETVITDVDEASGVLKSVEREMETRYDLLSDASVRNVTGYNEKFQAGELDPTEGHRHMPYLVVVVDELADLMMAAGDDVEGPIARLAQMARAVGIHLVLATQRPSVDVITGLIKANFPSRVAYEVASQVDSRTILDQGGAEDLVGNGDLLLLSGSDLRRLQGPFVRVEEVETVVQHVANQPGVTAYTLPSLQDAGHGPDETLGVEGTDDKFEEAARVIVRRQQGSVSLLQRKLAVGYTRAARIVDQLEEAGIVGPFNGTKARDVLVDDEQELDELLHGADETEPDSDEA